MFLREKPDEGHDVTKELSLIDKMNFKSIFGSFRYISFEMIKILHRAVTMHKQSIKRFQKPFLIV